MKVFNMLTIMFDRNFFRIGFITIGNFRKEVSLVGFYYCEGDIIIDFLFKEYFVREGKNG